MGAFSLLGGTVLFFAGLTCLILVFVSITRRLGTSASTSVYYRAKGGYRDMMLAGTGIALIVASQVCFWFYGEIEKFIPFDESVPEMRISFLDEEYRTPRMILQSTDQNHQLTEQMVPLDGDSATIGVEVLRWGKLGRMLGLMDCYHINGIYFRDSLADRSGSTGQIPDYALNGGPSGFVSAVQTLDGLFPAEWKFLTSEPIVANARAVYRIQITPTVIFCGRKFENKPLADHNK